MEEKLNWRERHDTVRDMTEDMGEDSNVVNTWFAVLSVNTCVSDIALLSASDTCHTG